MFRGRNQEPQVFHWSIRDADEIVERLIDHFSSGDNQALAKVHTGTMTKEEFLELARRYLDQIQVTDQAIRDKVLEEYEKRTWGYYILDPLINDPDISDINVNGVDCIMYKKKGKREQAAGLSFQDQDDLNTFLNHIAIKNKVSLSDSNALQTFTDKESHPDYILRFSVFTRFVSSAGTPYIAIRKIPKHKHTMEELQEMGMFDEEMKEYLVDRAKHGTGILFTGKGASGKTTLMNAMLEVLPETDRTLVIQENEELFTVGHPDMVFAHVVTNRGEGKIQYQLKDLASMGLLFDLDTFVIGEIKGAEALFFLNAAYTGHKCWASVHGISATEAMDKLADYVKYASDYTKREALQMLHYVNTVVFMKNFQVAEVAEITGWDETVGNLTYHRVFRREEQR